jgi:hypothetical protein
LARPASAAGELAQRDLDLLRQLDASLPSVADSGHERRVGLRGERPGHGLGQPRQVGVVEQAPGRSARPAPGGDVLEEHPQVHEVVVELG